MVKLGFEVVTEPYKTSHWNEFFQSLKRSDACIQMLTLKTSSGAVGRGVITMWQIRATLAPGNRGNTAADNATGSTRKVGARTKRQRFTGSMNSCQSATASTAVTPTPRGNTIRGFAVLGARWRGTGCRPSSRLLRMFRIVKSRTLLATVTHEDN